MSQHDPQIPPDHPPAQPGASRSGLVRRLWGNRWLRLAAVAALVLLVVAPFAVPWVVHRFTHSITDDAFVETHVVNIAPQEVSGHLVRYLVQEHDVVAAGQLLAEIDPVPYREQVALLEAKLGVAEAQLAAAEDVVGAAASPGAAGDRGRPAGAGRREGRAVPGRKNAAIHHGGHGEGDSRGAVRPGGRPRPARPRGKGPHALCHALRERGRHAAAVPGGDPDVPDLPGGGEGGGGPAGAGAGGREEGGGGPAGGSRPPPSRRRRPSRRWRWP